MRHKLIKGFTLLEVLIALFIFTIVSMIMMTGLRTVLNSQSRTEIQTTQLRDLQMALLLISRDFEQAINRPITNAKNMIEPPLIGTAQQATFTHAGFANPLGQLQRSTLQRTQYLLEAGQLKRSSWPVLDQTAKSEPKPRVLLDNVTELRFEYLDFPGRFNNNWSQPKPPRAVRMHLSIKNWGKITQLYLLPAAGQDVVKPN